MASISIGPSAARRDALAKRIRLLGRDDHLQRHRGGRRAHSRNAWTAVTRVTW